MHTGTAGLEAEVGARYILAPPGWGGGGGRMHTGTAGVGEEGIWAYLPKKGNSVFQAASRFVGVTGS